MLVLTRKKDEKIIIDDDIEVTVLDAGNGQVQLGIDAPQEIEIHREEVYRKIEQENIEAGSKRINVDKLRTLKMDK